MFPTLLSQCLRADPDYSPPGLELGTNSTPGISGPVTGSRACVLTGQRGGVNGPSPGTPGSLLCQQNPRRTFQELRQRRPERKKDTRSRRPCTRPRILRQQMVKRKQQLSSTDRTAPFSESRGSQSRAVWPRGESPMLRAPPPACPYRGGREVAYSQIRACGSGGVSTQPSREAALSSQSVSAGLGSLRQDLPSQQAIGG